MYQHTYSCLACPSCRADLTLDNSVRLEACIAGQVGEYPTRLTPKGSLVDVDGLVAGGYHAGTACFACGMGLDEYEMLEGIDATDLLESDDFAGKVRCEWERGSRTLKLTGLPEMVEGIQVATELEITINYTGSGSIRKGITLDNFIIPLIVKALSN